MTDISVLIGGEYWVESGFESTIINFSAKKSGQRGTDAKWCSVDAYLYPS